MIVVIDTCVLRKALEHEKTIKSDEESRKAYELLIELLRRDDVIFVANSDTKREYYDHLERLKRELARMRVYPQSFILLRALMPKLRTVKDESHIFEFSGEEIGRKDYHLLNSAKTGALTFKQDCAVILTFAEDVYRGKEAKNGKGVRILIVNLAECHTLF